MTSNLKPLQKLGVGQACETYKIKIKLMWPQRMSMRGYLGYDLICHTFSSESEMSSKYRLHTEV
jgi:hypothetical protein